MSTEYIQDWEYYEVDDNGDTVDTVDIGFKTEAEAIADAQKYADENNVTCYVCTSIAVIEWDGNQGYVAERLPVIPEPELIKISPQKGVISFTPK